MGRKAREIEHGTASGYQRKCRCDLCRQAWADYMREWSRKNSERVNARNREKYAADEGRRGRIRAQSNARNKEYYERNKERIGEYHREYTKRKLAEDPQYRSRITKRYQERNPEKVREWQAASRERQRAKPDWPDRERSYRKKYRSTDKGKATVLANVHKRRARKVSAAGSYTPTQWQARRDYYGGRCYLCGKPDADTMDHVIPLASGGSNWPANLRPACMSCNARKHVKRG